MIDPISAMAAVSSAVNLIKKAASTVDDVRSLGPLLGRYYDAKHTAVQAVKAGKKSGGSNMAAAIEIEMALKQQADFERDLQMLFMQTGNIDVWNNIQERVKQMNAEDKAEEERERVRARNRKRQQQQMTDLAIGITLMAIVIGAAGYALVQFISYCQAARCGP